MEKKTTSRRAKAQALPGMEDRAIKPLHDAAEEYAEIRDERMRLTEREIALKTKVRDLMHKFNKTRYAYDGIEIELEQPDGEEKVKVKIAKKKASDDDAGGDGE